MMEREAAHIMIVAHSGTLYQCLARTLQEQLAGCQALICEAGAPGGAVAGSGVRLVLIHACCDAEISREVDAHRALHPAAAIALLVDDAEVLASPCRELFATRKVQGILPMTLKLEVWLAAVLLLLSGGEYYPVLSRREPLPAAASPPQPAAMTFQRPSGGDVQAGVPAEARAETHMPLTAREREILELLSEGHQNKLIAHKMSLSEHTVKVHVHNLLSKLRVSNRTQAAAIYRRDMTASLRMAAVAAGQMHGRNGMGDLAVAM